MRSLSPGGSVAAGSWSRRITLCPLVHGRAGAGKTTLIYIILHYLLGYNIPFFAFDFKKDYRHFLHFKPSNFLIFNPSNFKFNPLRPPKGVSTEIWMQAFTDVFGYAYQVQSGGKPIILECLDKLYRDYGSDSGTDQYPTMIDLKNSLDNYKLKSTYGRMANFLQTCQGRFDGCVRTMRKIFDVDKGFSIEDLLKCNVVLELVGLRMQDAGFLITIILRYIFQYKIINDLRSDTPDHVLIFDEGKLVFSKKTDSTGDFGSNEMDVFASQSRAFGESLIVADQVPNKLSDSIWSNVRNFINLSQSAGPQIQTIAMALTLSPQQVQALQALIASREYGIYQALVKSQGRYEFPFIVNMREYNPPNKSIVTNDQVSKYMDSLLVKLNEYVIPRRKKAHAVISTLPEEENPSQAPAYDIEDEIQDEPVKIIKPEKREDIEGNLLIRMITNMVEHPFITVEKRREMLGMKSTKKGSSIIKELEQRGFIKRHIIDKGRRSDNNKPAGNVHLFEVLDKGLEEAKINQNTYKKQIPGKGSFDHKYWQHIIKEYYEKKGQVAEVEKFYNTKSVDVLIKKDDGFLLAVEIELGGPDRIASNVMSDINAGIHHVIATAKTRKRLENLRQAVEEAWDEEICKKVSYKFLSDFLEKANE
ncbi:MAG: ATP-binding protein [Candidatus Zixiibacteriota bacterium]|nr:MAG: ATP-binding protein [candidate division Zixibacteria bacterium]